MEFKRYKEIEEELIALTRTQQYKILLQTKEWRDFRKAIFSKKNFAFKICYRNEGPIEIGNG